MTTSEESFQSILRISDIVEEPTEMLAPIVGYEDMPIVPLERAVEPLIHLLPVVQNFAYSAKQRCKNPPADGLTIDESASIMLYIMGWKPLDKCLYVALNATLRSEDREKLEPRFLYLKLFLTALERLPSTQRTVYRGVKVNIQQDYHKGKPIVWWGFSSCTTSIDVLQSELFLGKTGDRTMFAIECNSGKDIKKHSYFQREEEILLLAATQFKVIPCLDLGNGLHQVQLQEIKPPFPLLKTVLVSHSNKTCSSDLSMKQSSSENVAKSQHPEPAAHPIPSGYSSHIHSNIIWKQDGFTIAGGNGRGNRLNQLSAPYGIYVDDDDQSIYIADCLNHRIVEWKCDAKNGKVIAGGNGEGNQMDQLSHPIDVIVDKNNDSLIICDWGNRRVVRWYHRNDMNPQIIISDIDCWGVTIDNNEDLYVSDGEKNEVRRWKIRDKNGTIVTGGNGKGNELNQLNSPSYIFVDENHTVYVSDMQNHRVMKWLQDAKEGIVVAGGQRQGDSLRQLSSPHGVTVDHLGNVYMADFGNDRIMRWPLGSQEGSNIVGGNGRGEQSNQFNRPRGLSFDRQGNLYIVDEDNNRVQKFDIL